MKKISDEFTALPVSRQRKYQLRKAAAGLCIICGQRPAVQNGRCRECKTKASRKNSRRIARGKKPFQSKWLADPDPAGTE